MLCYYRSSRAKVNLALRQHFSSAYHLASLEVTAPSFPNPSRGRQAQTLLCVLLSQEQPDLGRLLKSNISAVSKLTCHLTLSVNLMQKKCDWSDPGAGAGCHQCKCGAPLESCSLKALLIYRVLWEVLIG